MKLLRAIVYLLFFGAAIGVVGCSGNDPLFPPKGSESFISLLLKASSTGINQDAVLGEDRVTEVRMMAFDQNGNTVHNGLLNFPNGFNNRSEGIKFNPGIYTFYFIANESVYSGFTNLLTSVTNSSQFQSDARFSTLQYDSGFQPDVASASGRFLMSAVYENIQVFQGGTEAAPNPLMLPTPQVELIRSLAKVEVIFRKRIPSSNVPVNSISSVQLQKVAKTYSLPPLNSYYTGQTDVSQNIIPAGFDYNNDSIGSIIFYIPELLNPSGGSVFTELHINGQVFPVQTDDAKAGLTYQRRSISSLSNNSVIRNYHYRINAYINLQGGVQIKMGVVPWAEETYMYMFQDPDQSIVVPPVQPTDSSTIIPTACGKIEIRSNNEVLTQGLMGVYNDQIIWWDQATQGPMIAKGNPPYYCEQKYGPGWRLINSCELMSFLALFDQTYRIWQSNTWQGVPVNLPFYSLPFRQQAQALLERLTGVDLSSYTLTDSGRDSFGSEKLGIIDSYFTPGDIIVALNQFPNGWPYPAPPFTGIEPWFPMEVVHQVKGYWYGGYLDYTDPDNYDKVLYSQFQRFNFSSTISRCVRSVE